MNLSPLRMEGKDRITDLDGNLLSQILSRLRTVDVVRTSILSKGWRYKWTLSYNLAITESEARWPRESDSFLKFMNRILECYHPQRGFRLNWDTHHGSGHIQGCISSALKHRLEVIELECGVLDIVIPCSLLNSTFLKKLTLRFYYTLMYDGTVNANKSTLNVADVNSAPSLTSLYIMGVYMKNENHNTSTTVKFNFPLLEIFTLDYCEWLNVKCVELHAPSLTMFQSAPRNLEGVEYEYSFVISAPRLAMFTCASHFPEKFIMDGSSIISAKLESDGKFVGDLEFATNIGIRVGNLLNGFSNLEELRLSDFVAKVLKLGPPLSRHDKLRQLSFRNVTNPGELFEFLHAAPSLKSLKMNLYACGDYDYGEIGSVPSCIVSHLEEVIFVRGFFGEEAYYNLLKFLLKNGEKLKKLKISMPSVKQYEVKVKELVSAFPSVEFMF